MQVIGFWQKEGEESHSVLKCFVEFSCKDSLQNALAKDSIAVRCGLQGREGWAGSSRRVIEKLCRPSLSVELHPGFFGGKTWWCTIVVL